jgi:hypothetical protein
VTRRVQKSNEREHIRKIGLIITNVLFLNILIEVETCAGREAPSHLSVRQYVKVSRKEAADGLGALGL